MAAASAMMTVSAIGVEHLALDAGKREDRQVDDDDDQLAEQAGLDAPRCVAVEDDVEALAARQQPAAADAAALGRAAQAVLDDDDRAIDDEAEVERAEAHQVGADPGLAPCR